MKQLSARPPAPRPRLVVADLDGTLLGPGGSLFAAATGGTSLAAARAVVALADRHVRTEPGRTLIAPEQLLSRLS